MKNKKLFLKIYISFVIAITIALIVLQILGSKKRIGYLIVDKESLNNYFLTNENITNYSYHFKIGYYDKIFKHSDIYGVYPDLSNLPDFVREAKMDAGGSPFRKIYFKKIEFPIRFKHYGFL